MFRRLFAAVASTALIASLSMSPVSAVATPDSVLRVSFQAYWSGGDGASYATWGREAQAWFHAANTGTGLGQGAVRIGLAPDQEYCSSNVFGIWVVIADPDKAALLSSTYALSFGPFGGTLTPLPFETTMPRRAVDPQGFWWGGDPIWWQSVGVPVYGSLAPGVYTFHVVHLRPRGIRPHGHHRVLPDRAVRARPAARRPGSTLATGSGAGQPRAWSPLSHPARPSARARG
jgi:hypothetical protein